MMLVNMMKGGMISAHDYRVAKAAATALCGGNVDTGSKVDEEWLLTVERQVHSGDEKITGTVITKKDRGIHQALLTILR